MKAISIRRPWVNLIVHGISGGYRDKYCRFCEKDNCSLCPNIPERRKKRKTVEIRSWKTNYRGELEIHCAKKMDCRCRDYYGRYEIPPTTEGAIVATSQLVNIFKYTDHEHFYNDIGRHGVWYNPQHKNIFGWVLENVSPLKTPIPCKGQLGLWDVPEDIMEQIRCQPGISVERTEPVR